MTVSRDELKRDAAIAALEFVVPGAILGIGTGSTADHFIDLVGERFAAQIPGAVASSERSAARLRSHGITVVELNDVGKLSLYVDGADEFDANLALMKGGGGALTREKIVAQAAERFVCVVDESKEVEVLGAFPLPVEVIPMATALVARKLRDLGGRPVLRDGFTTDNGNLILDTHGLRLEEPAQFESEIQCYPGVVTCGVFALRRADVVIMATPHGLHQFQAN